MGQINRYRKGEAGGWSHHRAPAKRGREENLERMAEGELSRVKKGHEGRS